MKITQLCDGFVYLARIREIIRCKEVKKMAAYQYDHVHIISRDPEKAAKFYEMAFDAKRVEVAARTDGRVSAELNIKGTRLLLISARDKSQSADDSPRRRYGLEHFGLRTDNLEAAVADLKAKGVKFVDEIRLLPSGAKIAFLQAPDNVLVELVERGS
ncbi:VOC family protein [Chloroflexota bacterium]